MVVGIVFEVRLVCFVGVEVDLVALQDLEGILETPRDLLVDEVERVSRDLELL